ncbi:uncharacterized protein CLS isoform X1 [Diabrotica undecimpunctata]|uniref:uncharacterized protein CLS isoform X1 n=1 Tax=Diabrotica undecimpunctata TaxID=50387 RepID=UPI003B632826
METLSSSKICGRRIIDVYHFSKALLSFTHCGLFSCDGSTVELLKETRKGLESTFLFQCNICKSTVEVSTDDPHAQQIPINTAAVTGVISVGLGYSSLKEWCSTLNMSVMLESIYKKTEEKLMDSFYNIAMELMLAAGKEEESGGEGGEVDPEDNKAVISVIADGAWARRSNKSVFSANSGVACIIGKRTGKLLYLGVKNKYCCVCASKNPITPHVCYKNYNSISTAMESAIVVEGFVEEQSIQMHNLKYKYFIADGDSSTYKKICEAKPYGNNFFIEKIECKNHVLRNFVNRLREQSSKKHSSAGKAIPLLLRSVLKSNIQRLRTAIDCAVKYHRENNSSDNLKILRLQQDMKTLRITCSVIKKIVPLIFVKNKIWTRKLITFLKCKSVVCCPILYHSTIGLNISNKFDKKCHQ